MNCPSTNFSKLLQSLNFNKNFKLMHKREYNHIDNYDCHILEITKDFINECKK